MTWAARWWSVVVLLGVLLGMLLPTLPQQPASAYTPPEATSASSGSANTTTPVFVGVAGLSFEDLDPRTTPTLWQMAQHAELATMTPRSVRVTSCPVDGWLAVGAGRRAADEPRPECRKPTAPLDGWVPDWDIYAYQATHDNYDTGLGGLNEAVARIAAIGPGAAIASANAAGQINDYESVQANLAAQISKASDRSDLVMVDLGNAAADGYSLSHLDDQLAAVLAATGWRDSPKPGHRFSEQPGAQPVLFASVADGQMRTPSMQLAMRLAPAAAGGAGVTGGLLTSASTRQPGLVQVTDITPSLLAATGTKSSNNFAGAAVQHETGPGGWDNRLQLMFDRQTAVATQAKLSQWFFPVLAGMMAVLLLIGWAAARRGANIGPAATNLGLLFAALPVSTYLVNVVPWPRSTSPDITMLGVLIGFAGLLAVMASFGPWRKHPVGPLAFIAACSVVVLAYDVLTGSGLQMSTLLGEPLLIASRFYGIGNSALALYCTSLLLLLAVLASLSARRWVRITVILVPVLASCVLLATPGLGTKFGSVPTLIVGVAFLLLAAAELRMSVKRLALFGGIALAVMLTVLVLDWLRPAEQRTHFGRFFASVLNGEVGAVLARKIGMNVDILTQSWMTLLLPVIIAGVFWVAIVPQRFKLSGLAEVYARVPLLRSAMISLAILLAVGTVINDSGIVVPAVGVLFLVPALAHLTARGVQPG